MSHEIRTPLNGVIGFANLLFDQKLTENQHEKVGIIKSCGEHLLSIINDFLDYSKIESGNLELEKTPFNIKEAFDSLTFLVNHLASQNGVNIHISIPDDIPQYLMGDITRLKQILINLTNNAVKFTKDGEIWISVTASAKQQGVYEYQFEVKDTGIGMSEEGQSKLFSVFTQADSSTTRKFGGTGLGLAISKNLTELMGGRIWVKSKLGEGSTFYFTISAEVVDSTMVETREKVKNTIDSEAGLVRPLEILVAEDNRINQKLIMGLLSKLNYQADLVDNGLKAVEAALKKKYDIIFMDVQMPEMDGLDATRKISARLIGSDKPVIVGVTANNMEGDRERCFASGMDEYIPKPIRITSLSEVLEKTYSKLKGNESGSVGDGADELNTPAYVDKELLLDQEALLMDYKDAPDVLHKVIGDFLANHNDLQSKINCAIQDQDAEALGACAHSLVSALTGLHANKAAEIASQLEKAAKSNQLLQAHRIYMSLLEEFDILVPLLWSLAGKNVA